MTIYPGNVGREIIFFYELVLPNWSFYDLLGICEHHGLFVFIHSVPTRDA